MGSAGVPLKFAAVPLVFAALFGMSPETSTGNCACASVPVVTSVALTVTFPVSACPFTVVEVGTYPGTTGVPVKTGDASGAFVLSLGCTWSALAQLVAVPTAAVPFILGVVELACAWVTICAGVPEFAEI